MLHSGAGTPPEGLKPMNKLIPEHSKHIRRKEQWKRRVRNKLQLRVTAVH